MVQRPGKIRKLCLKFRKFINHQNQKRHLFHTAVLPALRKISPDIADSRLVKESLAALHLAFQRQQTSSHILIQIGNASGQMREPAEGLQQAGSLKVHQNEIHILRGELQSHGGNPALSHLRFAAARGSRYKTMRPVFFLMNIKIIIFSVFSHTNGDGKSLLAAGVLPEFSDFQLLCPGHMIAFQKSDLIRKPLPSSCIQADRGHTAGKAFTVLQPHFIRRKRFSV